MSQEHLNPLAIIKAYEYTTNNPNIPFIICGESKSYEKSTYTYIKVYYCINYADVIDKNKPPLYDYKPITLRFKFITCSLLYKPNSEIHDPRFTFKLPTVDENNRKALEYIHDYIKDNVQKIVPPADIKKGFGKDFYGYIQRETSKGEPMDQPLARIRYDYRKKEGSKDFHHDDLPMFATSVVDLTKTVSKDKKILYSYFDIESIKYGNICSTIPPGSTVLATVSISNITNSKQGHSLKINCKKLAVNPSTNTNDVLEDLTEDDLETMGVKIINNTNDDEEFLYDAITV